MSDRAFLFLISSTRRESNSEALARRAAATLPADVSQRWLRLDEHPLPAFVDQRHDGGFGGRDGHSLALVDATLAATDLVFVTPVYWYSLPAGAKLYLDHWTAWMRDPALDFRTRMKGRRLWAVVVDSSEQAEAAFAPLVDTLVRTADYMDMRWMGALHGHGNRPGDVASAAPEIAAYFAAP